MLHPDLAAFLEMVAAGNARPMHLSTPDQARADYDAATPVLDTPGANHVQASALHIGRRDGGRLPLRLYRPPGAAAPLPLLVFFHGGGYCVGGLDSHDSLCRDLAALAPCAVLAVDYRLAPEHRFPAAVEDAWDAYEWARWHADALGCDAARVAVAGDSAGGTLATGLAIASRDAGLPQPAAQVLLYPCTSATGEHDSRRRYATGHLLEAATLRWMMRHYLGDAGNPRDWRFAPLECPDLAGLAPAHIVLAECDMLTDEGLAYGQRLREAGVSADCVVYPGMVHDFARLGNIVPDAMRVRRDIARRLAAAFATATP
ncbi:alpha/beta hydrolase [Bordetella bronchialis]|uniref:Esterase n=1 Tax=Bordetella bronchialis TaxID=463025 RepID=A0ABN4R5Z7_9BORD|nr:alpha/beta hydrolase [Bordetella bronchialis]ANN66691.1 esterase [Bordetella bronchialis]